MLHNIIYIYVYIVIYVDIFIACWLSPIAYLHVMLEVRQRQYTPLVRREDYRLALQL